MPSSFASSYRKRLDFRTRLWARPGGTASGRTACTHCPHCGFTLIELVVVMLIIGILAVVVLPRFDLLTGFDEVGYRDKVKATLEFARKSAVAQRRYSCVSLGSNNLTITIDQNVPESYVSGTCPANPLPLPATDRSCSPAAANKVCAPSGVTLGSATTTLIFSPLGRPTAGASYTVTGSTAQTVTVEAETGYVH